MMIINDIERSEHSRYWTIDEVHVEKRQLESFCTYH
jgi:hypothetical protein